MEPLYTVKCNYTFEKYKAFAKAVANRYRKLWLRVGLIERGMILMAILNFKRDFNLASVFFFARVIFPFAMMFEQSRNIKKAWESGKLNDNLEYTYEFYDDHFLREAW